MTTVGNLKIHSQNILPIIKKWLYSEKDIFVRELVSNACDAIRKVKILSDQGEATIAEDLEIRITIDKKEKTITFSDTGIGMDAEEVEKYIAQIAFSGAEDFVAKYSTHNEKDQIIGHFGLGFYSAYMVAERVTIDTLSYKKSATPVFWSCEGSSEYEMGPGTRTLRGTSITLHLIKDNEEFLDESKLNSLLTHYCGFLPYPIYLNDKKINHEEPLWIKPALECSEKEYKDFYRTLYPFDDEPLFWVHLNVDFPFHLKGILYFPKIRQNYDFKKTQIKLFCNRVFVSDNCQELLPEYLTVLRGVLDSPDIPLNVSRSYLQMDKTVRQLAQHISKKVADRLTSLDFEAYIEVWPSIELIVKLGAMQDEKFYDRIKDRLIWKNDQGKWVSLETFKDKVFYSTSNNHPMLSIYKNKGIDVLIADSVLDTALMNFLEGKKAPLKFQRVDGAIDDAFLDPSKEKTLLDAEGKTEAAKLAQFIRSHLKSPVEVEAKSLASESLPAVLVLDEQSRRMRDYMAMHQPDILQSKMLPEPKRTFVVNTNSKLMQQIATLKDEELVSELIQNVYDLSQLAQKEMDPANLSSYVERAGSLLERLAMKIKS